MIAYLESMTFKDWNADTADVNSAGFHGFLLNPFLSAIENPRNPRSIIYICNNRRN